VLSSCLLLYQKEACFSVILEVLPALLLSLWQRSTVIPSHTSLAPDFPLPTPPHSPPPQAEVFFPDKPGYSSCQAVGVTSVSALSTDQWRKLQLQPQRRKAGGLGRERTDLLQVRIPPLIPLAPQIHVLPHSPAVLQSAPPSAFCCSSCHSRLRVLLP